MRMRADSLFPVSFYIKKYVASTFLEQHRSATAGNYCFKTERVGRLWISNYLVNQYIGCWNRNKKVKNVYAR